MRVLQIGLSAFKGGIETCIFSYAKALSDKDIVFDYVDIYGDGLPCEDEIKALGGKIYTIANYKKNYFKAQRQLKQIIEQGKYKCVHINMLSLASLMPVKASLKAGVVPLVHCHNSDTVGIVRKTLHSLNGRKIKKLNIKRLACGQLAGEWMFGDDCFEVLPNAVDVNKFKFDNAKRENIRKKFNLNYDDCALGFVGRLSVQKNPCFLVKILAELVKVKPKAKLIIVGDGPLKEEVKETARKFQVENNVVFAGKQDDVASWYAAMDILLLPSLFEGFVIVAVEAQASGLSCLVSKSITKEVFITDLVSANSLEDSPKLWVDNILDAVQNKKDRTSYGDILSDSKYSIEKASILLRNIYENQ